MTDTKWYAIEDLYTIEKYKIKHNKNPKTKWIRLPCVYKIKINENGQLNELETIKSNLLLNKILEYHYMFEMHKN